VESDCSPQSSADAHGNRNHTQADEAGLLRGWKHGGFAKHPYSSRFKYHKCYSVRVAGTLMCGLSSFVVGGCGKSVRSHGYDKTPKQQSSTRLQATLSASTTKPTLTKRSKNTARVLETAVL
jgi:hypothetical protein